MEDSSEGDTNASKRIKLDQSPTQTKDSSTPGRTDDLTSHSSDDADMDNDTSSQGGRKSKLFNAPKRPKTAYMIFLENSKAPFFEKNPKATFNEYQKYAGQLWRSFSQEEKMPWIQSEIESRKEFFKEIQDLQTTFGLTKEQSREVFTPLAPRDHSSSTPKTAFPLYVQAMKSKFHAQNPGMSYNELQKELSKEWRAMTAADKQVWIDMAKRGQKSQHAGSSGGGGGKSSASKKGVMLPRGPRSAYTLFYQCARKQLSEERPELSFREFPTICSQLWRNMADEEKQLWQADATQDRERYEKELLDMASKQSIYSSHASDDDKGVNHAPEAQSSSSIDIKHHTDRGGGSDFNRAYRDRSSSSTWQDIGMWPDDQHGTLGGGVATASNSRKRKNYDHEPFSPLLDDNHMDFPLHSDLGSGPSDLPPLSLSLRPYSGRESGGDGKHDEHSNHSHYGDSFDDLATMGHSIFDLGVEDDSHIHHDMFPASSSAPSSTKSNDGLSNFLGFQHDDIFGHESSLFN